jgi:hypothetical protein
VTAVLYQKWKRSLLDGDANSTIIDDAVNGPFCALVDTASYTLSQSHQFYSSLGGIVGTDQRIVNAATIVGGVSGVFDGDNLVFTAVAAGPPIEALVIYRHNSGANTTWRLISYYDTAGGGLPVTPNGGNITITWSASGIFQL